MVSCIFGSNPIKLILFAILLIILIFLLPSNFFNIFIMGCTNYTIYLDLNYFNKFSYSFIYFLTILSNFYYYFYNLFFDFIYLYMLYLNIFYKQNLLLLFFVVILFFIILNVFFNTKFNYVVRFKFDDVNIFKINFLNYLNKDLLKLKRKVYFKYLLNFFFNTGFK